jgi:hypothetical protein
MSNNYSIQGHLGWMDRVRRTVDEILKMVETSGSITLGQAEKIAQNNDIEMHFALAELESRCQIDYATGVIRCRI